jgi:hypothetical protein
MKSKRQFHVVEPLGGADLEGWIRVDCDDGIPESSVPHRLRMGVDGYQ